jgi:hypothetical protein
MPTKVFLGTAIDDKAEATSAAAAPVAAGAASLGLARLVGLLTGGRPAQTNQARSDRPVSLPLTARALVLADIP